MWWIILILLVVIVLSALALEQQLKVIRVQIKRQQEALEAIAKQVGAKLDPLDFELVTLLERGERREAIARLKTARGFTHAEASDYLDTL